MRTKRIYWTVKYNRSKRTYTFRLIRDGVTDSIYRSYPQGKNYRESLNEQDIRNFLIFTDDWYIVAERIPSEGLYYMPR